MPNAATRISLNELIPPDRSEFALLKTREALRWKTWFYQGLLPVLARRGAVQAGQDLERAGSLVHRLWRPRRNQLLKIVPPDVVHGGHGRTLEEIVQGISVQFYRYMARDCLLSRTKPGEWADIFEVEGFEAVEALTSRGQAAIFLGSHLGGHLSAVHWMIDHGIPFRLLVQRPRNVSIGLDAWFDRDHPICAQRKLFLRRDLNPAEVANRMVDVRRLIRNGISIYTNCDISWSGPNTDGCRFLGQNVRFQSIWIDLAMILGCPVIGVECRQLSGGRFRLTFRNPESIGMHESRQEVFLRAIGRLERSILEYPDDAIAHLTWSLFRPGRKIQPDMPQAATNPRIAEPSNVPRIADRTFDQTKIS